MAELRRVDGTVRWTGDNPRDALAAMLALGDEASDCILFGMDSGDLEEVLPSRRDAEARDAELAKLAKRKVELIEVPPQPAFEVVNEATGAVEQTHEDRKSAEAAVKNLHKQIAESDEPVLHMGEEVSYKVRSPLEVVGDGG